MRELGPGGAANGERHLSARAVFLDRDGTLTELVYDRETGYIDSAAKPEELRLVNGAGEALKRLREAGYGVFLVSNQPGLAKGRFSAETFEAAKMRLRELLASEGVALDGEYYCLHHPSSLVAEYRLNCDCRKPAPGMLVRAAREHGLNLALSYMVGDDLNDIKAGVAAGCSTVFIGRLTGLLAQTLESEGLRPAFVSHTLLEAAKRIASRGTGPRSWVKDEPEEEAESLGARAFKSPERSLGMGHKIDLSPGAGAGRRVRFGFD